MDWIVISSFLFFTCSAAFFSWYKSRSKKHITLNSFFLADRNLGFLLVGCGLLFTNINTSTIIGENELSPADRADYAKAKKLIANFAQNMSVMTKHTGVKGDFFSREDTLKSIEEIVV